MMTTYELTPNAISLLIQGCDPDNIDKILFQCQSCLLYFCWADFEPNHDTQECPRCHSADLASQAQDELSLPQAQSAAVSREALSVCNALVEELNGFLLNEGITTALQRCQQAIGRYRN